MGLPGSGGRPVAHPGISENAEVPEEEFDFVGFFHGV